MSDVDEIEIPTAFKRKYGDCRIPSTADVRAWKKGRLSASQSGQGLDLEGRPITTVLGISRWANPVNPTTGRWTPSWKPMPTGEGLTALRRVQFKAGSPRAIEMGRKGGQVSGSRPRTDAQLAALAKGRAKRETPGRRQI
jgi:hypothetical protein